MAPQAGIVKIGTVNGTVPQFLLVKVAAVRCAWGIHVMVIRHVIILSCTINTETNRSKPMTDKPSSQDGEQEQKGAGE